ncbi:MAG TPA: hypothetical protein VGD80_39425 [Kofleriaceae bacterium]
MTATHPDALAFECGLSFEALHDRLNELGPWTWRGTESDTYGDYLSSRPGEGVTIRIFDDKTRWVLQISVREHATVSRDEIDREFAQRIFPAIGARNIQPTDTVF